jgi:aromatic ring-opening dioxygenase LigB subunit
MGFVYACIAPHPPVIVPEVGRGREAETAATIEAMRRVAREFAERRPDTALVVSPHGPIRYEAMGLLTAPDVGGTFAEWGAGSVSLHFQNDMELAESIREEASAAKLPVAPLAHWGRGLDWGCTVPLYYLRSALEGVRLLPMTISFLEPDRHYEFGLAVARAVETLHRRVVFVCSADLSHALTADAPNGYDPAGHLFDEKYCRAVAEWDVNWVLTADHSFRRHAAEDAIPQTSMLMGALSGCRVLPRVFSYEGPFGVGYMVAGIDIVGPLEAEQAEKEGAALGAESG